MAKISVVIPDELERKLRKRAFDLKEGKRGGLSDIITEALTEWLERHEA